LPPAVYDPEADGLAAIEALTPAADAEADADGDALPAPGTR
jgi:hypothetical protein